MFILICGASIIEICNFNSLFQKFVIGFITVMFILVAGLRYETGVDWRVYTSMFEDTPPINEISDPLGRVLIFSSIDYGYCIFISVVKSIHGSIQAVFFIISLIGSIFVYKSVKIYSDGRIMSMLLYFSLLFFILDMSGLRQGFALSIFFYSLQYVYKRKFWPYLVLLLLAGSFHWSAYLLIPLYFLISKRFSNLVLTCIFLISLSIFMLKIGWLQFVFVHIFSGFSNEFIASKIFTYTDTYESGRGFSANTIASIIFYVSTFILCLYYRLNLEGKNKYFNMFLNIYMCQVVSYFALYEFIEMADRLRLYFLIANLILLPSMVFVFISLKERVLIYTYLIAFAFFSCKPYVLNEQVTIAYHPYQNFIIYNLFDLKSTGAERLDEHARIHEE
jgi:hypothetical protein